jgi:hypothetical protein
MQYSQVDIHYCKRTNHTTLLCLYCQILITPYTASSYRLERDRAHPTLYEQPDGGSVCSVQRQILKSPNFIPAGLCLYGKE